MEGDRNSLRKINELTGDVRRSPFEGFGKPEALRFELSGSWSRRIGQEHRLVCRVAGTASISSPAATAIDRVSLCDDEPVKIAVKGFREHFGCFHADRTLVIFHFGQMRLRDAAFLR